MYSMSDCKKYAMFAFGMNPSADEILFHDSGLMYTFKKHNNPSFAEEVVDFLFTKSLTHTIVDVCFSQLVGWINSYDVYIHPSTSTNIDSDLIDSVMKNINGNLTR